MARFAGAVGEILPQELTSDLLRDLVRERFGVSLLNVSLLKDSVIPAVPADPNLSITSSSPARIHQRKPLTSDGETSSRVLRTHTARPRAVPETGRC